MKQFYLRLFLSRQLIVDPAEDYRTFVVALPSFTDNPTFFSKRPVVILAIINIFYPFVCVPSSGVRPRPLRQLYRISYSTPFPDPVPSIAIYFQARDVGAARVECAAMQ